MGISLIFDVVGISAAVLAIVCGWAYDLAARFRGEKLSRLAIVFGVVGVSVLTLFAAGSVHQGSGGDGSPSHAEQVESVRRNAYADGIRDGFEKVDELGGMSPATYQLRLSEARSKLEAKRN
jgi:hypothetical protein